MTDTLTQAEAEREDELFCIRQEVSRAMFLTIRNFDSDTDSLEQELFNIQISHNFNDSRANEQYFRERELFLEHIGALLDENHEDMDPILVAVIRRFREMVVSYVELDERMESYALVLLQMIALEGKVAQQERQEKLSALEASLFHVGSHPVAY